MSWHTAPHATLHSDLATLLLHFSASFAQWDFGWGQTFSRYTIPKRYKHRNFNLRENLQTMTVKCVKVRRLHLVSSDERKLFASLIYQQSIRQSIKQSHEREERNSLTAKNLKFLSSMPSRHFRRLTFKFRCSCMKNIPINSLAINHRDMEIKAKLSTMVH